ncbi:MAG TPA: putative porin [Rariglobus sp.]|jgi:hypothetical protein|nr:putative porin [Rariglobus sp.]
MIKNSSKWLALLGGLAIGAASLAHAQDSGPLIDALVKKGVLTDQEAEEVRADLIKDFSETSAGKLNISSVFTELKLSGDARVRYEYRTGENGTTGDMQERNRYRYRLRLALTGKLHDGWFFGTRLEPLGNNRSTNVTAGGGVAASGPFNKEDSLALGQVYIGREMGDFTVTAGRMPNPLETTSMTWDDDINPEGLAEQWSHESGKVTWLANLGQFTYESSGTTNPLGTGTSRQNTFLYVIQGGAKIKTGEASALTIAPAYYGYSGNATGLTNLTTPNSNALRPVGLQVVDIPLSYSFKIAELPAKVWVDYAHNFDADTRATAAGKPTFDGENNAYQIGFGIGKAKAPGTWEAKAFWQSVDAFALDSNLVDSDLFDGRTNMEGFVLQGVYALSDGVSVKFTYANGDRKNDNLATYGAGDIATANLTHFQLFQADLNVKF